MSRSRPPLAGSRPHLRLPPGRLAGPRRKSLGSETMLADLRVIIIIITIITFIFSSSRSRSSSIGPRRRGGCTGMLVHGHVLHVLACICSFANLAHRF